jgi:YYY domain-containing protein
VLAAAAFLRFRGLDWDERTHPHPDERFLTMVEGALDLEQGMKNYFNTAESLLNPHNVGYGFFVYGTLPIFIVRAVAESLDKVAYDQVHMVGRFLAASFDLITVLLVYFVGRVIYHRRVGLLAAALAAFSVLPIQQAHFFVVDSFTNTFIMAAFLFAALAMRSGSLRDHLLFGLALGAATASKVNAAPLAGIIVVADLVYLWRLSEKERGPVGVELLFRLALAALVSLVAFRIFQPYAFQGPGFFNIRLNPEWLADIREISAHLSGEVDSPPALQWVDRPRIWFGLKNLVLWGLGLPLGLLSWMGWLWAGWRLLRRGEWEHAPLVVWTGGYFLWRASSFTVSMRHLMPVYPTLVLLAAWAFWRAWRWAQALPSQRALRVARTVVGGVGLGVVAYSAIYAFGFLQIYLRPHTQVAASRWIYEHIPAGINLRMVAGEEEWLEPLPIPYRLSLADDGFLDLPFLGPVDGSLIQVRVTLVGVEAQTGRDELQVELLDDQSGALVARAGALPTPAAGDLFIDFSEAERAAIRERGSYRLRFRVEGQGRMELGSNVGLTLATAAGEWSQELRFPRTLSLLEGDEHVFRLVNHKAGRVEAVLLPYVRLASGEQTRAEVHLLHGGEVLTSGELVSLPGEGGEKEVLVPLARPVDLQAGEGYEVVLRVRQGALSLRGSYLINETSWDLGLPFRVDGRDGFGGYYEGLNLELYWSDSQDKDGDGLSDKYERIRDMLSRADYLIISTNRQYGTISRVPSRYPLTTAFYRALFGCPPPRSVLECGAYARPGEMRGELGYELIAVFESHPRPLGLELNDQLAEEAFTVYDHPKVLIFAKSQEFSVKRLQDILAGVDVSRAHRFEGRPPKELKAGEVEGELEPMETPAVRADLLLPPERWGEQQAQGTWAELFGRDRWVNRWQPLTVLIWYATIALIGLVALPLTFAAFSGLADRGYPMARLVGLLLLSWAAWMGGSLGFVYSRASIAILLLLMAGLSLWLARRHWPDLKAYLRSHWKVILWTELLFLGFFLLDLGIRSANPDLWHPFKGGEKPMDFAYLNAVLKSTRFPPYDPWFAGGYINYYYFGFVLVGTPIKLLGVVPAVAYNLVLPTLFAMLAAAAYCFGLNLLNGWEQEDLSPRAVLAGLAAAAAILLLGNLGTLRLLYEGLRVSGGGPAESPGLIVGLAQAFSGLAQAMFGGGEFPIALDRWYWDPSRAIKAPISEAGPITEFPLFTFIYGDLHAHMINLPLTVAVLVWALGWLREAWRRRTPRLSEWMGAFFLGALFLGALRPTNTWDFPVYWSLAGLAAAVGGLLRLRGRGWERGVEALASPLLLLGLAYLLYLPYSQWYVQPYSQVELWKGSKTSLVDYFVVHGVFLYFIATWMAQETIDWMSATPISALSRLRKYSLPLGISAAFYALLVLAMGVGGYPVAWVALPMALWAGLLLLRKDQALGKRVVLMMVGTGLMLTLLVEVIVLRGDIGRMNTVFKFYLQVWTLFSLSAAAAGFWLLDSLKSWPERLRAPWAVLAGGLLFAGAMFFFTAAPAKARDRMAPDAPRGLDGMAYMAHADYGDIGGVMSLHEDYEAIRWVQDNVPGTPVIVEATAVEYRWGSRYSIYTGLPAVFGWNWHQRQQRGVAGDELISERVRDVPALYITRSVEEARAILDKYNVRYIIVGQMERNYFERLGPCRPLEDRTGVVCDFPGWPLGMRDPQVRPEECTPEDPAAPEGPLTCPTFGLEKFERMQEAGLLRIAYQNGETVIYEVVR